MNNVLALTKIYIKNFFTRLGTMFTKKNKKPYLSMAIGVVSVVAILALVTVQLNMFFSMFTEVGLQQFIISYGLLFAVFMSVIIAVVEIPGHFYKSKDYEMLASLPLKNWEVVFAKLISAYASILFYNLMVIIPTFIVYFIYNSITILAVAMAVFSIMFLPMFVLLIGCVFGFVVYRLTANLKNKSMYSTVFMIVLVIGIMLVSYLPAVGGSLPTIFLNGETPLAFKIILPYIYFLNTAIYKGSLLYFIYFILTSLLYLLISVLVISITYTKINSNILTTKFKFSSAPLTYKKRSPFLALFKKESKSFFGSTIWTTNVIVGPLMILLFAVASVVMTNTAVPIDVTVADKDYLIMIINGMYLGFIVVLLGLSLSTSSTISMEAKTIQILKQLPVSFNTIAYSKIAFNCVLVLVPVYLANIIFIAFNHISMVFSISFFIIPVVAILAYSTMGLVINLRFPKLNWRKEVEVVKQSASIMLSVFPNMLLGALPLVLFFVFLNWFLTGYNIVWFVLATILFFSIYWLIALRLLKTKGEKLFEKIY